VVKIVAGTKANSGKANLGEEQGAARAAKAKGASRAKSESATKGESATTSENSVKRANNSGASWTFLTNYAHVLICLAREPELTLREVSLRVGITERAVQRIVADLEEASVLMRQRDGRRNRYEIQREVLLRHPLEAHRNINDLLTMVLND
jgi:predicted transcriptional regulator